MYDSKATLYELTSTTYDTSGNEQMVFNTNEVFCYVRGVYHSEYYEAAQAGLKPSIVMVISNRADYKGEQLVEWNGTMYNVIRVDWVAQRDSISLTLEERVKSDG